jgi:hypothetical protein
MMDQSYEFIVPKYNYKINMRSPYIEMYRYEMITAFVDQMTQNMLKRFKHTKYSWLRRKVYQYFSQMLMSIITDKTYNVDVVELSDGLFNNCEEHHLRQFYADMNYLWNSNDGDGREVFKIDEYKIEAKLDEFITRLEQFQAKHANTKFPHVVADVHDTCELMIYHPGTTDEYYQIAIKRELYDKTMKLYKLEMGENNNNFHRDLMCCLIRYETLHSGANQYVVDLNYKSKLKKLGFNFEAFASVFNNYFDNYCSLFYDLERDFGSKGSFMALKIIRGIYMANPPYDENLLYKMYQKVKSAVLYNKEVLFIMSIPKWDNYPLEHNIDEDNIYMIKSMKKERFHNPMNLEEMVEIPPYYSYIFKSKNYDYPHMKELMDLFTYKQGSGPAPINLPVLPPSNIIKIPMRKFGADRQIIVIDDGVLVGGTKQRAMGEFMASVLPRDKPIHVFFPASPNGLGCLALALGAADLRKCGYDITPHIYSQYYKSSSLEMSKENGADVHVYKEPFREIYKIMEKDMKKYDNAIEVSLGGNNPKYIEVLAEKMKEQVLRVPNWQDFKHFWLVYGSGTLYKSLLKNFPQFTYHLVVVGKSIKEVRMNDKVYEAPSDFYKPAHIKPPYKTEMSYDGKIWEFLMRESDPALVWNVGYLPKDRYPGKYDDCKF